MMLSLSSKYRDLFSTLINQLWRLVSGPLVMLLIPLFLSETQQGYWYLFGSLSALTVFADLGFSNIVLQFSAHEYAFLSTSADGLLSGDTEHLKRLGSFFKFTVRWISIICIIVFPVIYIVGIWFFVRDGVLALYLLPWTLFSFGSLFGFFGGAILSFLEGMDKIAVIQKMRFAISVFNTLVVIGILLLGSNIYALSFASLLSSCLILVLIAKKYKRLLTQLLEISKDFSYNWRKEIVPLFFKYALSFSSGYFIFQIYTPLMHYFHGPVLSGKVGISLSLVTAIFSISNIWMYTIVPKMNMLVSQARWGELDRLLKTRLILSVASYVLVVCCFFCFIKIFGSYWILPKIIMRFLPLSSLLILLSCYLLQLVVNSWALYLRAHKQEPYVIPSLLSGVWIAAITFLVAKYMSPSFFFVGFLSSYIWSVPIYLGIFIRNRRLWHKSVSVPVYLE